MLISSSKLILEQRLKGIRPLPDDTTLTEYARESILYLASRTTPSVLTRDLEIDGQDYTTYRVLEDNKFIVYPATPVYDIADPAYSDIAHLNIDEELSYAVVYYMAWLIMAGNEATGSKGGIRAEFLTQVDKYISLFDSNYSRAGRETYGIM